MPIIEIEAIDTLFFRDGKPFDRGEDNWAEGMFPPSPRSIYGAIRTAFFTENPVFIPLANTKEDPTQSLNIKGLWLKHRDELFVRAPLDYVRKKAEDSARLFPVNLISKNAANVSAGIAHSVYPFEYIPFFEEEVESSRDYIMGFDSLLDYDPKDSITCKPIESCMQIESKIGLGLDKKSRSNRVGNLYRVGLNRINEIFDKQNLELKSSLSLVVDYDLEFIPAILKLGGEGKVVKCSLFSDKVPSRFQEEELANKAFRLIFITPTFLHSGFELDINKFLPEEIVCDLVCAFVGNRLSQGGWNMKGNNGKGMPKQMDRLVPAGSTYYFEIKSNHTYSDILGNLESLKSLSSNSNYSKEGFGLFVVTPLNLSQILKEL